MKDFVTCIVMVMVYNMANFVNFTKVIKNPSKEMYLCKIKTGVNTIVKFTKITVRTGQIDGRPS